MMSVEIQSFKFLFQALALSLLLSFSISAVYYEYIRRGGSWRVASQFVFIIPILVSLFLVFYTPIASNSAISSLTSFVLLMVFLYVVGRLPRFRCKNEEDLGEIENIPVFLCHEKKGRICNAWYDQKRKKIGITKSLFDILSEDERLAVLYHEVGHSKSRFWNLMTRVMFSFWLITVSAILTMLILVWMSNYDCLSKIVYSAAFLAYLPMYAVSFMISSWVNEHEADSYAVEKVGFKPITQALIKLHIYTSLKGCEKAISGIEFSDSPVLDEISFLQVLRAIIWRVFRYIRLQTVLNQPLPETHPALRLRLERIIRLLNCSQ